MCMIACEADVNGICLTFGTRIRTFLYNAHQSQRGKDLHLEDTLRLPTELSAAVLSEQFERAWLRSVNSGHPSIVATLHSLFAR